MTQTSFRKDLSSKDDMPRFIDPCAGIHTLRSTLAFFVNGLVCDVSFGLEHLVAIQSELRA